MKQTLFVNHEQSAIIVEDSPAQYTVTAYTGEKANVSWTTDTYGNAERWAKIVIEYPAGS